MFDQEDIKMIAPCGIYCGVCPAHTCKDNPQMLEALKQKGVNPELLPCQGCRANQGVCAFHEGVCATFLSAREHDVDFCFDCDEYPCSMLYPCADQASILPHNLKVLNLTYIQKHGIKTWKTQYQDIIARYYTGKMSIGKGPQLKQ